MPKKAPLIPPLKREFSPRCLQLWLTSEFSEIVLNRSPLELGFFLRIAHHAFSPGARASLPSRRLCLLSVLGLKESDLASKETVSAVNWSLGGWRLASDGRLYHPHFAYLYSRAYNDDSFGIAVSEGFKPGSVLSLLVSNDVGGFVETSIQISQELAASFSSGRILSVSDIFKRPSGQDICTGDTLGDDFRGAPLTSEEFGLNIEGGALPLSVFDRLTASFDSIMTAQAFRSIFSSGGRNKVHKINANWILFNKIFPEGVQLGYFDVLYSRLIKQKNGDLTLPYLVKIFDSYSMAIKNVQASEWVSKEIGVLLLGLPSQIASKISFSLLSRSAHFDRQYYESKLFEAFNQEGKRKFVLLEKISSELLAESSFIHTSTGSDVVDTPDAAGGAIDVFDLIGRN